ncbi:hypothetical protein C8F04DRAFT_1145479 [Mycena alexandri]|uniref:Uncharacterized protein n=1 Tax=Mycena alexandri TaxID=1745969 RepID=A0AAD6S407_9AGAR|nr:hypothetical protein C8F04DRAFT_1145479 [Mycena alexandri]
MTSSNPPLVLPPPQEHINEGLDHLLPGLPVYNHVQLAAARDEDQYEHGERILVGLKDFVFDLSRIKAYIGPGKLFASYGWRDISYALTKSSNLTEDTLVEGYTCMSPAELELLDKWVALFLKRFQVVGRMEVHA